jgi:hypothetical protein
MNNTKPLTTPIALTFADESADRRHDPIVALVPAQILWAAAQFASADDCKEVLTHICLRTVPVRGGTESPAVEITSTDGHRLFRAAIPSTDHFFGYSDTIDNEKGFKLKAKPLRKRVAYAHYALIRKSGIVEFIGGKKARTADTLPTESLISVNASSHPWEDSTFPHTGNLWPDRFGLNTERPIAFNASYLADFCNVVSKLSLNGTVKMERNSNNTPAVLSCDCDIFSVENCVTLEYLIMPVVIRG